MESESAKRAQPDQVGWDTTACAQADLLLLAAALLRPPVSESSEPVSWIAHNLRDAVGCTILAHQAGLAQDDALIRCVAALRGADAEGRRLEHGRLFEGAPTCPPNETAYVRRDKGAILADLCGFYHAFGFDLDPAAGEKADHVVCELEFGAALVIMLARAERNGLREEAATCRAALASFAADHLGEWLPGFCQRLATTASGTELGHMAAWLPQLWRAIQDHHDLPASPDNEALEPHFDSGDPYECGLAPGCGRQAAARERDLDDPAARA